MNDTANPTGAESIEVIDVQSAAEALMAREQARETEVVDEIEEEQEDAEPEADTAEGEAEEESDDSPETDDEDSDEREADEAEEGPQFHSVEDLAEALEMDTARAVERVQSPLRSFAFSDSIKGRIAGIRVSPKERGYLLHGR